MLERLLRRARGAEEPTPRFDMIAREAFRFLETEHGFRPPVCERYAHEEEMVEYGRADGTRVRVHLEDGGDYVGVELRRRLAGTARIDIADPHVPWDARREDEMRRVVCEYAAALEARVDRKVRHG